MMWLRLLVAASPIIGLLAGCAAWQTPYQRPAMAASAAWRNQPADGVSTPAMPGPWWRSFGDPQLDALIDLVLARNADLAVAAIRIRQAQLQADVAAINPIASLSGNAGSTVQRNLRAPAPALHTRSQTLTATVSYELDLWGKLASQRDAAQWELQATAEDRESAALALVGTTATLYWRIANLHQHIAIGERSQRYVRQILELVRRQHEAGAVSSLDLLEAERAVAAQQLALTRLHLSLEQARTALALLFDPPLQVRHPERQTLSTEGLPAVDAGLPAQLLARRPDLRAAELRLRSTLASTDVARASFYPTLALTGTLGSTSTALSNFLRNPVATLGAGLALPFLEWHQVRTRIGTSQASHEAAAIGFRQTFYRALSDVENALYARGQLNEQARTLRADLARTQQIEHRYGERYAAGAEPLRVWLAAQEAARAAQIAVADNDLDVLSNQLALYQALGGGTATNSGDS